MKTWIIVLSILFVVFKIATTCIGNYIRNDKLEMMKYKALNGATNIGIAYALCYLFSILSFGADCILLIIYIL